jgi:hypothetical protein
MIPNTFRLIDTLMMKPKPLMETMPPMHNPHQDQTSTMGNCLACVARTWAFLRPEVPQLWALYKGWSWESSLHSCRSLTCCLLSWATVSSCCSCCFSPRHSNRFDFKKLSNSPPIQALDNDQSMCRSISCPCKLLRLWFHKQLLHLPRITSQTETEAATNYLHRPTSPTFCNEAE